MSAGNLTFTGGIRAQAVLLGACLVHGGKCTVLLVTCMLTDLEGGADGGLCQVEPVPRQFSGVSAAAVTLKGPAPFRVATPLWF